MESLLVWGLGLIGLAIVLLSLEFFVSAAGAFALSAAVMALVGVGCLFFYDLLWGAIGSLVMLVLGPASFYWGLKVWPHTGLGRRVIGAPTDEEQEQQRQQQAATDLKSRSLIGKEGVVVSDLRPIGAADFGGTRMEVISESSFVPVGARVRIISISGPSIKVRELH